MWYFLIVLWFIMLVMRIVIAYFDSGLKWRDSDLYALLFTFLLGMLTVYIFW